MLTVNPMVGEKKISRVSLASITVSHNPRQPMPEVQSHLVEEGYCTEKDDARIPFTPLQLVHKLALSEDPKDKTAFVALIEKYDPQLMDLAASRAKAEIEPIVLRSFRSPSPDGEYVERYGVVVGERRLLAAAYNHCKLGIEADIGAVIQKLTVAEAFELAVDENAKRRNPSELEYGHIFHNYRETINPATGKCFTLQEIAAKFGMDYTYVRSREALVYLSESDQRRVNEGTVGITVACFRGLKIKLNNRRRNNGEMTEIPEKKDGRQRVLSLAKVQSLFDDNREHETPFLNALAMVMQTTLDKAMEESDARIAAGAEDEIAAANKTLATVS